MKTQRETTIQFSGYPLGTSESQKKLRKVELAVVRPLSNDHFILPKNKITDDPRNWDFDWFNNYE